jgi:hypothetical protein
MFELTSLALPDGTQTYTPNSVAIDTDGTSAMAYTVEDDPRRVGIAILYNTGYQLRIIQTQPLRPSQVCFAPDHSLWAFAEQWQEKHLRLPDFMTFRHYSRSGELLGSFVPRSSLPAWEGLGLDQVMGPFGGLWRLRTLNDRIGAALRIGPSKEAWVELNLPGELIGQWTYTTSMEESVFPQLSIQQACCTAGTGKTA